MSALGARVTVQSVPKSGHHLRASPNRRTIRSAAHPDLRLRRPDIRTMTTRILLIEDDAGITMALTDLLRAEDFSVESAADGLTGLARAGEGDFDVIILDVMLPGKSGFDGLPGFAPAKYHYTHFDANSSRSGD